MHEANILYAVTGVVIAGLMGWVGLVLATAKEPWGRPRSLVGGDDTTPESAAAPPSSVGADPPPVENSSVAPSPDDAVKP